MKRYKIAPLLSIRAISGFQPLASFLRVDFRSEKTEVENMDQETRRILIADDEEAILFSYKRLLRGARVEVDTCANPETAIALIKANNYSAVITDFRLSPSEDQEGLEILRQVRKHRPETPVILMTSYGNDEVKEKALALGAADYLDKPVPLSTLFALFKELGIPAGEF